MFFGISPDLKGTAGGNPDQSKNIQLLHPAFHPFSDHAGFAIPEEWEADSTEPPLMKQNRPTADKKHIGINTL